MALFGFNYRYLEQVQEKKDHRVVVYGKESEWKFQYSMLKILLLLATSFVLVFSSLFWTKEVVNNREDLLAVHFGWPLPFVAQDQTRFEPPFPWAMSLVGGNPSTLLWGNFLLDELFYLGALVLVGMLYKRMRKH